MYVGCLAPVPRQPMTFPLAITQSISVYFFSLQDKLARSLGAAKEARECQTSKQGRHCGVVIKLPPEAAWRRVVEAGLARRREVEVEG